MSGFVAALRLDGAPADAEWASRATGYLAFRGPDAQNVWQDGPVALGHALLRTTLDSSDERQPCSLDGQVWVAADARIDGQADLRAALRARGREVPVGAPDVELVLHAYALWGEACVDRLIGDFAFALWDGPARRLFCARDRMGAAPLYYARAGGALLVSNTLNALRLHPGVSDELDEGTLGDYMLFRLYPASDATTFSAIRRVRPAHTLVAQDSAVRVRRYWSLPEAVEPIRYARPGETVEHFRSLFEQAVGDRLRTDALATQLSGGMDSGSIAATAHRLLSASGRPFDLRGYTMVHRRVISDDEGAFAQQTADHCGFRTEPIEVDDYCLHAPTEPRFVSPEPCALPGQVPQQEIVERASAWSRVLLMGFGGDPLFAPRRRTFGEAWAAGDHYWALRDWAGSVRRTLRMRMGPPAVTLYADLPDWFEPGFAARAGLKERWEGYRAGFARFDGQRTMATAPLWETIFIWGDAGFVGVPVKGRWPFFDVRLLEFALAIPPRPWARNKHLLREAMAGILPETVRLRRKTPLRGFPDYAVLQARGVPAWMRELADAPEIAPYADRKRLAEWLDHPSTMTPGVLWQFMFVLYVAWWLRHEQRPIGSASPVSVGDATLLGGRGRLGDIAMLSGG